MKQKHFPKGLDDRMRDKNGEDAEKKGRYIDQNIER